MKERTEEDKIVGTPLTVTLGGKEYPIRPLVIRDSSEWRKKVIKLIAPLPRLMKVNSDSPEDFENVLNQVMVSMPDQVIELFFEYAKDLDRDEIETTATDVELAKAFEEVVQLAFPLVESGPKALARFR